MGRPFYLQELPEKGTLRIVAADCLRVENVDMEYMPGRFILFLTVDIQLAGDALFR